VAKNLKNEKSAQENLIAQQKRHLEYMNSWD
jgi:hypothetical protein